MKREHSPFFGTLFGGSKIYQPTEEGKSTPVTITAYSQPHVLQQRMREEKLTHGETVTANISPVRLESHQGKMVMYFCPMKNIKIIETITNGDGGIIPDLATVEELSVPQGLKAGFYTLKNVTLTSNGTMQVKGTEKTIWEYAGEA